MYLFPVAQSMVGFVTTAFILGLPRSVFCTKQKIEFNIPCYFIIRMAIDKGSQKGLFWRRILENCSHTKAFVFFG